MLWAVMAAALAYGLFALRVVDDGDLWYQLMAGRWVLDHGSVPKHEIFLYPGSQAPQVFGGWGFGLIYELGIRIGGLPAASWINAAMWAAVGGLAGLAAASRARRFGWDAKAFAPGLLLALAVVGAGFAGRMGMRAEVTLYIFWMGCMALMDSSLERGGPWRFLVGFPLCCWAEAWLHTAGFVLLPLWLVFLTRSWSLPGFKGGRLRWPWLLSLAMALALPALNPNGSFQVYVQAQSVLAMARQSVGAALAGAAPAPVQGVQAAAPAPAARQYEIIEYLPVTDQRVRAYLAPFLVLLAGALALGAHWAKGSNRSPGWWMEAGLVAAGAFMAGSHVRGLGLCACFMAVPLAEAAVAAAAARALSVRAAIGLGAASLALMGALMVDQSWGVQPRRHPFAALTDVIKARSPHGANIFSSEIVSASATYLLGEDYKMAHGGHELRPNPESNEHFSKVVLAEDGWQADLDRYHVDYVCLPYLLDLEGGTYFYWANAWLAASPDWKLLVDSRQCALFGREPQGQKLSQAQVDAQTLEYLDNLQVYASVGYQLYHGQQSKELADRAKSKAAALRSRMGAALLPK